MASTPDKKSRLDQSLVELGLAPSKTKAQQLIAAGQVQVVSRHDGSVQTASKPSQNVNLKTSDIRLTAENVLKYVSRGGFKLEGALANFKVDPSGMTALDIGQSTGGFTDCLLQAGAKHVVGVDVAQNELVESLARDPRVETHLGVNARELETLTALKRRRFDVIVIDVSFISLEKVLPAAVTFLAKGAPVLALVKPQFEVGAANIGKKGLVKSPAAVEEALKKLKLLATQLGLVEIQILPAKIKGSDGNQEYFLYGQRAR